MQLVIAEKPSVAMALSKVLGAKSRGDGYMEGGGWLVSWCIGHLRPPLFQMELCRPADFTGAVAVSGAAGHQKAV